MSKIKIAVITVIFQSLLYAQSGWFQVYGDTNAAWQWNFFTDANTGYAVGYKVSGGQVFPRVINTTNAGTNWTEQLTPERDSANFYFRCVFFTNTNAGYIAVANSTNNNIGRVLRTTNGGSNWNIVPLPVNKHITNIFFVNSSTGYASGYQTMLKTTNGGDSWEFQNTGFPYFIFAIHFTDANTGYASGNLGAILKTSDGGNNWITLNTGTNIHLWGLSFADANTGIAAGGDANNTQNIILRTTNAGNNWSVIPYTYSSCLLWSVRFISPTTGYIIGWCSQILKTTNGGLNWYNQSIPENNNFGRSCFFTNANTGYIAGEYAQSGTLGRVYKTTDGGGNFVGIQSVINESPSLYKLYQNYPNPFNPSTKIQYDVPNRGFVKLVIYDAIGRIVKTLVNGEQTAGTYYVDFDGENLSSGIYFYKLEAGSFTDSKKMLLAR